ncbi:MAG: FGGY family carbohydrate kinase [Pseudomonadota bacterium]
MAVTLGIDLGTQATKVLIYDSDQRQILASESAPLNLYQDANGTAEQQTHWWTTAITEALAKIPTNIRQSIQALAVSGQQHGFVPLDEDGNSLAPVKLWCDTSTETECQQITEAMGGSEALFSTAGNPILVGYTASKVLNFRKNHPKSYARLHTILLPHDYVNFWLTGVRCMEAGDASGTGFMDVRSRHWSEEVLRVIDPNQNLQDFLPDIGVDNTFIGEVSGATAGLLGIPAGTPVAIGGGDNMMGAIGTGNLSNGRTTISLGTSGTVYAHSPVPIIDNHGHIAAFCSSTGGWLPLLCTMNCTVTT